MKTMENTQQKVPNQAEVVDFGRLFGLMLDHKWLIAGISFLFAIIGVTYALCATPIYQANALIQVEEKTVVEPSLSDLTQILRSRDIDAVVATEIELIKSSLILGETVDELNLDIVIQPDYGYGVWKGLAKRLGWQAGQVVIRRFNVPIEYLGHPFELIITGENTFDLLVDDQKVLSGKVGETLTSNVGIQLLISDIKANVGKHFTLIKKQRTQVITDLQQNLIVSVKGKKTGILILSLQGDDQEQIQSILEHIAQIYVMKNLERNRSEVEKRLDILKSHLPGIKVAQDASEQKLNRYRQQNESVDLNLEAKATLDNIMSIEMQLNEPPFKEFDILQQITKSLSAEQSLSEKHNTLLQQKNRLNRQVQKMPKVQQEILNLTRDFKVSQQIYMQLLNKIEELNILKAETSGNVRIIDNATVQIKPVKPKKVLVAVIATLLGGMLAVAIVLIRAALNRGIEGPEALEQLGINVYASVPLSEWQDDLAKQKKGDDQILLAQHNPADLSIEVLRSLRTSLQFAMMESTNNVLMVTGSSPRIGKSFITSNLASVIALGNQKVLLIDGDMRKGHLHDYFSKAYKDIGLSDYLLGQKDIQSVVVKSEQVGLDFIARGTLPPNPSELLMHPRFASLLEWATHNYDIVLIDTPSVLAVTDAAIVGRLAGTTFLVARFAVTDVKEVEVAQNRLELSGIETKGVILNAMEKRAAGNYGYYQY